MTKVTTASALLFWISLLFVAFSPTTGHASHVDGDFVNAPRTWYKFFDDYTLANQVNWQICDYMPVFGFTPDAISATSDWESTHGYGIDFNQAGTCTSQGVQLTFRSIFNNECGVPPPGVTMLGCWHPLYWSTFNGIPAATQAIIYYNTLFYDAGGYSAAQRTHNFAHELGHSMALAHHTNCTAVMSTGICTNQVEPSDVVVPRCVYGYTC